MAQKECKQTDEISRKPDGLVRCHRLEKYISVMNGKCREKSCAFSQATQPADAKPDVKFTVKAEYWSDQLNGKPKTIDIEKKDGKVLADGRDVVDMTYNGIQLRFELGNDECFIVFNAIQQPKPPSQMYRELGGE